MYEAKAELCRAYPESKARGIALRLADQLFEADAEFFLKAQYLDRAASRAEYYGNMQRQAVNNRSWMGASPPLRPYAILGHRLRLDLAVLLVTDDSSKNELSALGHSWMRSWSR